MARVFNHANNRFNQAVFFGDPVVTGPITVTATGVISETVAPSALRLEGGAYAVTINGLVSATGASGFGLELGVPAVATPGQISTLTLGETGELYGRSSALAAFHAVNVANAGLIAGQSGLYIQGGTVAYTVANTGDIAADPGSYAIWTDGAGTHTITNSGTITGRIEGSFADASIEIITNSGTLAGQIFARDGADVVTNSGLITGSVYLDGGDDSLVNTGTIRGDIVGGLGIDTIQNDGLVQGNVFAGDQNDILTNTGTIGGAVLAGLGNDSFTNTGTIIGFIFMGDGRDTLTGGAGRDQVADEEGSDRYALGDGIDNYDAVGLGTASGTDRVDGGLQTGASPALGLYGDEYNASDATTAVIINMNGAGAAATDRVTGLVHAGGTASGAETGLDQIKGFEAAFTGSGNDVIFGNADANALSGAVGDDHIFGGSGGDYLQGGIGADYLEGGAGLDYLDAGVDSDTDTIVYTLLTDSRTARSGRDVLLNFTDADRIDFGDMVIAGGTADHYVGTDVAFDGIAGGVRVVTTATGWLVQLDGNGDLVADMSIDVSDMAHSGVTGWSDQFLF